MILVCRFLRFLWSICGVLFASLRANHCRSDFLAYLMKKKIIGKQTKWLRKTAMKNAEYIVCSLFGLRGMDYQALYVLLDYCL